MEVQEQAKIKKILEDYQTFIALAQAQKTPRKEVQPLTAQDIMYLKAKMHPTKKAESIAMTKELLNYMYTQRIATAEQIYAAYGWSDKPLMKRMKLLKEFAIVKRVSKKYYLATPRLDTLVTRYIDILCK